MSAAEISILIKARDEASKVLQDVQGHAHRAGSAMGTILKAGALAAGAGLVGAGIAAVGFVKEAMEAQKVSAQTAAVLKSTGGAVGLTAGEIAKMSGALAKVTPFSDEAVQSGQNMLLTFTKIGKDVFPLATETMLNMSTALGQETTQSAMQLGKALNDPVAGVTALRKVGVALTDQQQEQVKAMVAVGDVAGAQKIILAELTTEFGGSARAAGETFAGKMTILKNRVGEVKESIGTALLPVLTRLADFAVTKIVPAVEDVVRVGGTFFSMVGAFVGGDGAKAAELFNQLPGPVQDFALKLLDVKNVATDMWNVFNSNVLPVLKDVASWLKDHVLPVLEDVVSRKEAIAFALGIIAGGFAIWSVSAGAAAVATLIAIAPILALLAAIGLLSVGVFLLIKHWDDIKAAVKPVTDAFADVRDAVMDVVDWFREHEKVAMALAAALLLPLAPIALLIAAVVLVATHFQQTRDIVAGAVSAVVSFVSERLGFLVTIFQLYFNLYWTIAKAVFDQIVLTVTTAINIVRDIITIVMAVLHGDWAAAWDGIKSLLSHAWQFIEGTVGNALQVVMALVRFALGVIQAAWDAGWNAALSLLSWAWERMKAAVSAGVEAVMGFVRSLPGLILGALAAFPGLLYDSGRALLQGLWNGAQAVWGSVTGWLSGLPGTAAGYFAGAADLLWDIGWDIINGLWSGMKHAWGAVSSWLGGLAGEVLGLKGPPAKDAALLVNSGRLVMEGFQHGLQDSWGGVQTTLAGMTAELQSVPLDVAGSVTIDTSGVGEQMRDVRATVQQERTALGALKAQPIASATMDVTAAVANVRAKMGDVRATVQQEMAALSELKAPAVFDGAQLMDSGRTVMEGFQRGLQQGWRGVEATLSGMTRDLQRTPLDVSGGVSISAAGVRDQLRGGRAVVQREMAVAAVPALAFAGAHGAAVPGIAYAGRGNGAAPPVVQHVTNVTHNHNWINVDKAEINGGDPMAGLAALGIVT